MKIKGEKLMVFMGTKSIAFATSHTLSVGSETVETSNKDENANGWTSAEIGNLNWSMTTENLYSEDGEGNNFSDLFNAMIQRTKLTLVFGTHSGTGDNVPTGGWTVSNSNDTYTGEAYISDLQLTAQHGQYATFTATFTGVGALTQAS